jgi:hypothetical protein
MFTGTNLSKSAGTSAAQRDDPLIAADDRHGALVEKVRLPPELLTSTAPAGHQPAR